MSGKKTCFLQTWLWTQLINLIMCAEVERQEADLWNDLTGIKDAEQDHKSSVRLTAQCARASHICKCHAKHKRMLRCCQFKVLVINNI